MDKLKNILTGKRILVVDDEEDVLESIIEILSHCRLDTASSFQKGKQLLETQIYDLAVLDIMGVDGFKLLKIANHRKIPALMLTAHAITEKNIKKSADDGAVYFIPKESLFEVDVIVAEVFKSLDKKKSPWERWFNRFAGFFDLRFNGTDWRDKEKEFWEKKLKSFY